MTARSLSFLVLASLVACTSEGTRAAPSTTPTAPTSSSAVPAAPGVVELTSGQGIGPVRVGMTRAELDALGLRVQPGPISTWLAVGPYEVEMEGDHARAVRVRLSAIPNGVRVGGTVFVASSANIETIAQALPGCGPLQANEGANVISCDGGKTTLLAAGPPGIVELQVEARIGGGHAASTSRWTHPTMAMSFSYPDKLLTVSHKPDGATLQSEILGKIEDRSGLGADKPQPLTITVSVRVGKLDAVLSTERIEAKDCTSQKVGGLDGCTFHSGSHDAQRDLFYAALPGDRTLEVVCDYLGDMGKPKVSQAEQSAACSEVVRTLAYAP